MKIITVFVAVFCTFFLIPNFLNAQDSPHQFSLGYGVVTTDETLDVLEDVITDMFSFGSYTLENTTMSGALVLTYNFAPKKWLHLGGALAYENIKKDVFVSNEKQGSLNRDFVTIAAEAKFSYVNANYFQMYSGLGAGITLNSDKFTPITGSDNSDTQTHFNFQLNLLGFRFGNALAGYLEIGYGYKGIASFGLSYRM
jgi:hypothetical protein